MMIKPIDLNQHKLYHLLGSGKPVWVLYLDIVKFHEVEFRYGYKACRHVLDEIETEIQTTLKQQRSFFLGTMLESRGGDDFVVYFVPGKNTPWQITEVVEKWVIPLEERFNRRIKKFINEKIVLRSGLVQCSNEPGRSPDYLLYAAIKEAFLLNKSEPDPQYFVRRDEVSRLLNEPDSYLRAAFQPIIDAQTGTMFGFEALSRINGTTTFSNIAELFPFAEKIGQLYPIETLCRRRAISSFPEIGQEKEMLFLNINPQVLLDPEFASGQTKKMLSEQGLTPSDVILEITERSAIENFSSFRDALAHYRNQGFLIALDDVGAGYSSLQSIAELHPDVLKVDRSLISGVNADPIKWALLETFVTFAKRIGCRILAEGVETAEEMRTVVQLGVEYIQGFFVARPSFERAIINQEALEILKSERRIKSKKENTILSIIEPFPLFNTNTSVNTVQSYFRNRPNQWLVGIIENDYLVGIIQRDKLFATLGTRYGVPLYSERTVSLLMDKKPLMVEDITPVEVVSSIAMQRPDAQLYDGIVVVNQRKPIGMVSVATLMKAMAERQIQIARGANPLTGLPGNMRIDQEIRQRIDRNLDFALIYADLNKFKHYNDLYGFQYGDLAIKMLAEILLKEAQKADSQAFIGHIGGDDFIVIPPYERVEECASAVIADFEKEKQHLLGAENLSVALAGLKVDTTVRPWTTLQVAEHAAQIKKEVKTLRGNAFLFR